MFGHRQCGEMVSKAGDELRYPGSECRWRTEEMWGPDLGDLDVLRPGRWKEPVKETVVREKAVRGWSENWEREEGISSASTGGGSDLCCQMLWCVGGRA